MCLPFRRILAALSFLPVFARPVPTPNATEGSHPTGTAVEKEQNNAQASPKTQAEETMPVPSDSTGTKSPSTHTSQRATSKVIAADPLASYSSLFALLIGVNQYQYQEAFRNLSGAVKDAERMETFLLSQKPPVSKDRIIFLKDSDATAAGIIRCIKYLYETEPEGDAQTNAGAEQAIRGKDKPNHGDPILIFYAGHGSTLPKPTGWESENTRIQCLSPHDARRVGDSVVNVIPDRTFGALLGRLAEAKGRNITVILDCCHSGSGTRNDAVPRGLEFKNDAGEEVTISTSYQQALWADPTDSSRGAAKFAYSGLSSHVVLAACGPDESAYEDRDNHEGRFTSAFLAALNDAGPDTLTYTELIKRLNYLPSQTPRCEGRDKDTRILFDAGLKQRNRDIYVIEVRNQPSSTPYSIPVGQIHGIGKGDVFAIYRDPNAFTSGGKPFASLVVDSVTSDSSFVLIDGPPLDVSDVAGAVAVLSRVKSPNAFRVKVGGNAADHPALRQRVVDALKQVVRESADSNNSSSSSDASAPRIAGASTSKATAISIVPGENNTVSFKFQNGMIHEMLGIEQLSGSVNGDQETLVSALRSAAHFFRFLGSSPLSTPMLDTASSAPLHDHDLHLHSSSSTPSLLRDQVDVRIWELEGREGQDSTGQSVNGTFPTGPFLDAKLCGLFKPKLSRVDDYNPTQTLYGVDVRNKSNHNLYVWLFYFDCSTLEISEYYSPPVVAGGREAPLQANMKTALPLNYGDAGGIPLAFEVPDKQAFDGGFLRIFLSTRPIDLSTVAQDAVVTPGQAMGAVNRNRLLPVADLWDAITIPVKLVAV